MRLAALAMALVLALPAGTAPAQTTPTPAPAQKPGLGDFAGSWTFGAQVMGRAAGGHYYVHGTAIARHLGVGLYSVQIVAMEQHWKVGEVIPPFSANQKCRGVSSGTELTLKCTITAGTPGYQPDEFKLTRNNSEVWGGTMAVGTSTRRMAVNFFRVS